MFLLVALLLTPASAAMAEWRHVPGSGGALMHESCVHEVADGTIVDDSFDLSCAQPLMEPNEQLYAMKSYTDDSTVYEQMNSSWVVPALPEKADGQVVYFWPGFKATQPQPGYPVLQPVLQYGEYGSKKWQLQSWFVWAKAPGFPVAVTGKKIEVSPGDQIDSFMDYDASSKVWTVFGHNQKTNNKTTLRIARSKAGNVDYKYALHVLETIMPASHYCSLYPKSDSVEFTGISANRGKTVAWKTNVQKTDCNQQIVASKTGDDVKMTWHSSDVVEREKPGSVVV